MDKNYTLITGASSGIGFELAKLFAKDKHNLILVARSEKKLLEIKDELIKNDIDVLIYSYDLSKIENILELREKIKGENIFVDILVNNAGFGDSAEFISSDINKVNQMVDLNMKSLTNMCYYFGKDMKDAKRGKILNVASVAAYLAGPYMAVYYATKAYVYSFSMALNIEMKKYNVNVSILCPGPTNTNFIAVTESKNPEAFNKHRMKSSKVAKIAYKKMMKNKTVINTGKLSKFTSFATRFLSRKTAAKLTATTNGK